LADRTTINVVLDKGGKAWPPVVTREEFLGFETARMTGSWGIVMESDNVATKGDVRRDVRKSFIEEKSVAQFPVGKSGANGKGNSRVKKSIRDTCK
jgi:hypothetical protein